MASDANNKKADQIAGSLQIDWSDVSGEFAEIMAPVAIGAAREVIAALGGGEDIFNIADEFGITYAKARGAELVGMRVLSDGTIVPNPKPGMAITETTRSMIKDKVAAALEEGQSVSELRTAIMDDIFGVARALMISRTETSFAHNRGQLEGAKQMGVDFKGWLTAEDDAVDDHGEGECTDNEAQGPIGIGETFSSGDDAPPAHPSCRCSMVYYTQEDIQEEGDEG